MGILLYISTSLVVLVTTVLLAGYLFLKKKYQYWPERNVPCVKPTYLREDLKLLSGSKFFGDVVDEVYKEHLGAKYCGFWIIHRPMLLLKDLDIIKAVLVKDFDHFHDRGFHVDEVNDPLSGHLFSMNGLAWRNLRVKLTPTFTSGKMKGMLPIMLECANNLKTYLKAPADNQETVEVKELLARFTTDNIVSCAFGIQSDCIKNPDSEFRQIGKRMSSVSLIQMLKNFLVFLIPLLSTTLKIRLVPQEVEDFIIKIVTETIEHREKNGVERKDFMQLMIQLKNKGYIEDADEDKTEENKQKNTGSPFTIPQAAAQAFVFFFAGFETSSVTLQFTLYELALNPDIQQKLREEIDKEMKNNGGDLSYTSLQQMVYLDQVISETLRKYPPVIILTRECTKEYQVPGTDLVIEKGTVVQVPTMAIQRDAEYFPDPDKFNPDRFNSEEKLKRKNQFSYLPFGEGPRICIGNRFALMQMKVGLATLISNFEFTPSDQTPIPVVFDPFANVLTVKGGMHLKIKRRN